MPLTDTVIRNATARTASYKLSDRDGLYLVVSPSGSKLWRFDYRFGDKRKTLALGKYSVLCSSVHQGAHATIFTNA